MYSHGKAETEKLKENLENQLERLVEQLADLENFKNDLEPEEYEDGKRETMEQLKELNSSLSKLVKGDISLVSALGAVQLATRAAVSQAFKTPEVIKHFGKREPKQLRSRLATLDQIIQQNKADKDVAHRQKAEILVALRQLGDRLSTDELQFLDSHNDISEALKLVEFVEVKDED